MNIDFYIDLNGGRLSPYYVSAVKEYQKRLGAYCSTKLVIVDANGRDASSGKSNAVLPSGRAIKVIKVIAGDSTGNYFLYGGNKRSQPYGYDYSGGYDYGRDAGAVRADLNGGISSEQLAERLQYWMTSGYSRIILSISAAADGGGYNANGCDGEVLVVSRMDMSAELLTVIAYEQMYRAWKIIRGEPYHK